MSQDWYQDVKEFMEKFQQSHSGSPCDPSVPDLDVIKFRRRLIIEETLELFSAASLENLPGMMDAVADLVYVTVGVAVACGVDIRPIWDAVHEANMAKVGGARRQDGKVMKPAGWKPPDVAGIIARQKQDTVVSYTDSDGTQRFI